MLRRVASTCVLLSALAVPAFAQDGQPPPGGGGGGQQRAPRPPARMLDFGATAPDTWKAPEKEAKGRLRYQLELKTPDGADVTVLAMREKREFAEYRSRLLRSWTKADRTPLTDADQVVEVRKAADPEIRVIEQAGTQAQREGEAKEGMKLIAVYVRQGEDRWSVWLLGPAAAVDAQRDAFLKWVDTARAGEVPAAPAPPSDEGAAGPF